MRFSFFGGAMGGPRGRPSPVASGGGFTDVPGPSGSLSITVNINVLPAGTTWWVVEYDTSSKAVFGGYAYKKYVNSGSTLSVTITGLASNTYYYSTRAYDGVAWSGYDNESSQAAA